MEYHPKGVNIFLSVQSNLYYEPYHRWTAIIDYDEIPSSN